jgi:hypothetical protein
MKHFMVSFLWVIFLKKKAEIYKQMVEVCLYI